MNLRKISLALLFTLLGTLTVKAQNANTLTPTNQISVGTTILGISEGVIYGSVINDAGNAVGFTTALSATNDILYTIVNSDTPTPRLWMTKGDFQANATNPSFPTNQSRFTEISGYSQGISVGNYALSNGVCAFLISNNPSFFLITYAFPAAKPYTTTFTGIYRNLAVGNYTDHSNVSHGFLYNISNGSYKPLDVPAGIGSTHINGISEGAIYGSFAPATQTNLIVGFIYRSNSFTTLQPPDAANFSEVTSCCNGNISGNYISSNGATLSYHFQSSNYTPFAANGSAGYSHYTVISKGQSLGSYIDTNSTVQNYFYAGSNSFNLNLSISSTLWKIPFASYPLHATNLPPIQYIPPPPYNPWGWYSGLTGVINVIYGPPVNNINSYTPSLVNFPIDSGTVTLNSSSSVMTNNVYWNCYNGNPFSIQIGVGEVYYNSNNVLVSIPIVTHIYNSITLSGGTLITSVYNPWPINGLNISSNSLSSLLVANQGTTNYSFGSLGSTNSLYLPAGWNTTVDPTNFTGINAAVSLTIAPAGVTNATNRARLILPNKQTFIFYHP